jgi:hypothetical protein
MFNQVRAAKGDTGVRQELKETIKAGPPILPNTGVLKRPCRVKVQHRVFN